jgi:hypothetical protein
METINVAQSVRRILAQDASGPEALAMTRFS